ncbi:uncharacterized protein CTRU02_205339 [Colletotrichum truncatum]|uniref:Uncharacterized protein n=1 Tax=Colletotrichum truncatum TaxID=5467 RepID=A0ACC3Z3S5_COLTU|nr:uncharacterized protein CTRU02_04396 [Colletotrichum truncatum]KAF6795586.1 hypothetical protein CTRU02_04396 [Colletotrichum truncatum]
MYVGRTTTKKGTPSDQTKPKHGILLDVHIQVPGNTIIVRPDSLHHTQTRTHTRNRRQPCCTAFSFTTPSALCALRLRPPTNHDNCSTSATDCGHAPVS